MILVCGAVVSGQEDGHSNAGSTSANSEATPSSAASAAVGSANLGPLCNVDFKVRPGAAEVYEEIARFGAPPLAQELFRKMSLSDMLRGVEANAAKVFPVALLSSYAYILLYIFF